MGVALGLGVSSDYFVTGEAVPATGASPHCFLPPHEGQITRA